MIEEALKLINKLLDLFTKKKEPEVTSEQIEEEETEIGDLTMMQGMLELMKKRRKKK